MIAVFLQVRLPLLKQILLNLLHCSVIIIAKCVGPFQNLAALDYGFETVFEEHELAGRVAHGTVQHLHRTLDLGQVPDAEFGRPLVIVESGEVPRVTRQLVLGIPSQ